MHIPFRSLAHNLAGGRTTAAAQFAGGDPIDETDLVSAWQQALIQLDLCPKLTRTCWRFPPRCLCVTPRTDGHQRAGRFRRAFSESASLLVVAGQDFGKALGMLLRPQYSNSRWQSLTK